ncbi:MAG: RNA polymerase sigma factor [Vicinamibacteraceae bacterium]
MHIDLADFEALYESHGPRMKSLALNMLGNVSDAEDAVQEAFLRAYRHRQSFRGDAGLWTWFYRILLNACHDIGRQRGASPSLEPLAPEAEPYPPSPAGDHPMRLALQRALGGLSSAHREVFLLYEVEGYKHREIAGMLGIPEGTSKHRLFEAKRQLKAAMRGATVAGGTGS